MINYLVKAQWKSDHNGKIKKHTEQYLVEAVSVTDAERKTVDMFAKGVPDFEVKDVKSTKIVAAI
jgi:hypothetical protein|tara:strand:- start:94 stop:288 length:195 start_codon:yes stop_codon:yes gene_type:complete